MRNNSGTTLIEMLVTLIVGGIMMLAIGSVSDIGKRSYQRLLTESSVYNDIAYGFKLIQNRIHKTRTISVETASTPWLGQKLIVGNEAFGVYYQTGSRQDFVHLPDKNNSSDRRVILSVLDTDILNATFSISGSVVTVNLSGSDGDVPFDISTMIKSRRL